MRGFGILDHNILPALIAFHFDLVAHNWRESVFGLTSNVSENLQSNLIELGFFTGTYSPGYIVMLSVNLSGVYTLEQ